MMLWILGLALAAPGVVADQEAFPVVHPEAADLQYLDSGDVQGVWNGQRVPAGGYPETVSLSVPGWGNTQQSFCSGTLISPIWVLTAAHCLYGIDGTPGVIPPSAINIVFGHDVNAADLVVDVAEVIPHPNYDPDERPGAGADIGLLRLVSPVNDVEPAVVLGDSMGRGWIGVELELVGYGVTQDGGGNSGIKRTTAPEPMVLFALEAPDLLYSSSAELRPFGTDGYWPHGASVTNVCSGDSGGSTFEVRDDGRRLVGVNAVVFPACNEGHAGSTRIDLHLRWIEGYVEGLRTSHSDPVPTIEEEPLPELSEPGPIRRPDNAPPPRPSELDAPFHTGGCAVTGSLVGLGAWLPLLVLLRRRRTADW